MPIVSKAVLDPACNHLKAFDISTVQAQAFWVTTPEGMGMTKSELIDAIAARADLTKARAEMVVNCVFDTMTNALRDGEGIEIRGFGSFTVRPYKPYAGRNPRTGNPVPVPAKRLPFFKVGKELKELVNNSLELSQTETKD